MANTLMRKKVPPVVVLLVMAGALGVVGAIGYKMILAPKPSVHGIRRDGKPMTDDDVRGLADGMSGGNYSRTHPKK